ncbi:MAG: DUF2244 domain-containing protein [Gammaproteobacteria bacterium]|nr:DUF2244 domain-containing protein [Gammaproteobacteria bacterium]
MPDSGFRAIVRPNCSLSAPATWLFVAAVFLTCMAIGIGFLAAGAWLVLPFAGLEVTALALAFWWLRRRSGDFEEVRVHGGRLSVLQRRFGREERFESPAAWARVRLHAGRSSWQPVRLWLRCHGREMELGIDLTDGARRCLADELTARVGSAY